VREKSSSMAVSRAESRPESLSPQQPEGPTNPARALGPGKGDMREKIIAIIVSLLIIIAPSNWRGHHLSGFSRWDALGGTK
jgi:hypothetical protein